MFLSIAEEQKRCLIAFLKQLAICVSEGAVLEQPATSDWRAGSIETQLLEQCHRIMLKTETGLRQDQIHTVSLYIMNSMDKDDYITRILNAFASVESTPTENQISIAAEVPVCDQQRILISNTKEAFKWTYSSQHALTAFLEYLDIQWLKMIDQWDPSNGGTLQSRCGTIIQSSCAGKSRLINE
jgi:hypothetical protein